MEQPLEWKEFGWRHPVWEMVRYYRSLRGDKRKKLFLQELREEQSLSIENKSLPIPSDVVAALLDYVGIEGGLFEYAVANLRTEEEALFYCQSKGLNVGSTTTKSTDHHQSSKAMISCVSAIAEEFCEQKSYTIDPDPQNRCVWFDNKELHVTSRNLDGAIPGLVNPKVIWEIKEYWGKTKGGSKMSDAVYECQLVGKELREHEERSNSKIEHIVFLDGKDQWSHRKSDVRRFIDLLYQGLIDHLFFGKEVETEWLELLKNTDFECN